MRLGYLATNLLNVFVGAVESLLGLRFMLKIFGANSSNGFVDWVYEMSGVLLDPFRGIFPVKVFVNQYVLEFSTLFAMLVYALIGLFVAWLIVTLATEPASTKKSR